jgi:hypothetical protein
VNFFGFYIDEKIFEYDEQKSALINCLVDHRDYKQGTQHKNLHDEYERDRKELKNYPKKKTVFSSIFSSFKNIFSCVYLNKI